MWNSLVGQIKFFDVGPHIALPVENQLPDEVILAPKVNGDNGLHWMLRNWDEQSIFDFLDSAETDFLSKLARTTNNKGQLPIDIAIERNFNKVMGSLTELTLTHTFKPLSEPIDYEQVLTEYHSRPEYQKNLELACILINKVRDVIKKSSTHPDTNTLPDEQKYELLDKIKNLRTQVPENNLLSYWNMIIFTNPVDLLFHFYDVYLNKNTELFIQEGAGNCGEMANIAHKYLRDLYKQIFSEIYCIPYGDHAFLVIGSDHKVVCDPWSGEAYPLDEISFRLHTYKTYKDKMGSYSNVVPFYNPRFHGLGVVDNFEYLYFCISLLLSPILLTIGISIQLGLFVASAFYESVSESVVDDLEYVPGF